ncbi:MAG: hypothetical protein RIT11_857, partial [Pseudomonadota bacterium]
MEINEILKNKDEIIAIKKAVVKHSDSVCTLPIKDVSETIKLALDGEESTFKRVIANTYYWLDSHGDVHVKGCFTKSIKESKIFHFDNHNHSFASKVGNVKSVKEVPFKWSDLGIDKEGKRIWSQEDDPFVKVLKSVNHIAKTFTPGSYSQLKRISAATPLDAYKLYAS